jgi:hypothetical protein
LLLLLLLGGLVLIVRVHDDGRPTPGRAVHATGLGLRHRGRENHGGGRDHELRNDYRERGPEHSR